MRMYKTIVLITAVFMGITACGQKNTNHAADIDSRLHIKTAPVIRTDITDTVYIYGEVRLRQETLLASQFDGRLADFSLLLGDRIKKGTRVGTIIPAAREALLQVMGQISVEMRPMLERHIKSIPLYSSIDGIVLNVLHHSGDVVQKGEPIVHIGDLRLLDVRGDLPVRDLPLIRGRKSISVEYVDYPHSPMQLPVEAVSGEVDPIKQTVVLRLKLQNPSGEFRSGMRVRMFFPAKTHKNTLAIPREALLEEEGVFRAFVLKGTKVEKRLLQIGIKHDDLVEILSGLQEGEKVATQKAYSLTDGMEVIVD